MAEQNPSRSDLLPAGLTLAIGSMPHRDPAEAIDLILEACPEAPCWPQLPALGFLENMIPQFSEGLPCLCLDEGAKKISFAQQTSNWEALNQFYENCLKAENEGNLSSFGFSPGYAQGFYRFLDKMMKRQGPPYPFIKGQITGPLTFGLSIQDEEGLPALFDDTLSDVVQKGILLKALWQIEQLKPYGSRCILFVDEPILSAFGSAAYINLTREKAVQVLEEIFSAIKAAGCLVGSHCCGNTEWSLMVEAGVDIINFDAFEYREAFALYADSLSHFFERGGYLAWGIVPSQSMEERPRPEALFEMLSEGIALLSDKGLSEAVLKKNLILSPSCGLGTLSEEESREALEELKTLSHMVRKQWP